jgi:Holliday junction resolvase-like predicted endonuclease
MTLRLHRLWRKSVNENHSPKEIAVDVTTDWFWEGNVVNALVHHLAAKGWKIESQANTHSRERGVDLLASKQGIILLVEAKGYPSKSYRDPRRANEQKSTNPINQAEKWYSHAVLKALRLQTSNPEAKVALAFPDFPRYRALFDETKLGLAKLGIAVLLVNADSEVREWGLR